MTVHEPERHSASRNGIRDARPAFISAIVAGATVESAANAAGVTKRTGFRWLTDPGVQRELDELRRTTLDHARMRVLLLVDMAAATLATVMRSDEAADAAKVSAARAVLAHVVPLHEASELERRLADIEAALRIRERTPPNGVVA